MKNYLSLMVVVVTCLLMSNSVLAEKDINKPAPEFTLASAAGGNIRLKELRGKVVLVNFWATWCGPCRQAMPALNEIYKRYRSSGLMVLGVNVDSDHSKAIRMAKKYKTAFPVLFDTEKRTSKHYDVSSMPFTVIIDRDGNIRYLHKNYAPGSERKYHSEIQSLLEIQ